MKRGFTLLELIVVIIIVGILATLGFTQYTRMIEKGRTAEAKSVLGALRTAEQSYYLERSTYTSVLSELAVGAQSACTGQTSHYFSYAISSANDTAFTGRATRCTSGGKTPTFGSAYTITVTDEGVWSGSQGYY